jgi:hypothetical protein
MARRRTTRKTTRRRSPKPMVNVANAAQTVIVANAATTAFFGTSLDSFLLDGWARPQSQSHSSQLNMAEIVKGIIPGGQGFGFSSGFTNNAGGMPLFAAMGRHLQSNQGRQALATMVFAPIAFQVGKKLLAKPLINPVNKGIRQLGLGSVLKV